jgi:hypothetical protein
MKKEEETRSDIYTGLPLKGGVEQASSEASSEKTIDKRENSLEVQKKKSNVRLFFLFLFLDIAMLGIIVWQLVAIFSSLGE